MEAKEVMIGDWVNAPIGGNIQISDFGTMCSYEEFKPIPLTEQILKANGYTKFFYGDESISFQIGFHYENLRISELIKNKDEDFFVTCMGLDRIEFHYVHQLQHAVRLCGLDELADNFKIE